MPKCECCGRKEAKEWHLPIDIAKDWWECGPCHRLLDHNNGWLERKRENKDLLNYSHLRFSTSNHHLTNV